MLTKCGWRCLVSPWMRYAAWNTSTSISTSTKLPMHHSWTSSKASYLQRSVTSGGCYAEVACRSQVPAFPFPSAQLSHAAVPHFRDDVSARTPMPAQTLQQHLQVPCQSPSVCATGSGQVAGNKWFEGGQQKEEQVINYLDLPAIQTALSVAAHSAVDTSSPYRHWYASANASTPASHPGLATTTSNSSSSRISAVSYYRMYLLCHLRMLVLLVLECSFVHPWYNRSTSRCPSQS